MCAFTAFAIAFCALYYFEITLASGTLDNDFLCDYFFNRRYRIVVWIDGDCFLSIQSESMHAEGTLIRSWGKFCEIKNLMTLDACFSD